MYLGGSRHEMAPSRRCLVEHRLNSFTEQLDLQGLPLLLNSLVRMAEAVNDVNEIESRSKVPLRCYK